MAGTTGRFFPVQTVHLGRGGTFANYNESDVVMGPLGFSTPDAQLGMCVENAGNVYRKVQKANTVDVATVAGSAAVWKDYANMKVSSKASESQAGVNGVAGGFLGVITNNNYCFIQIGGLQTVTTDGADGGAAAGDMMIGLATDVTMTHKDVGSENLQQIPFGVAWAAESAGTTLIRWLIGNLL
jgi:hypothetical protein